MRKSNNDLLVECRKELLAVGVKVETEIIRERYFVTSRTVGFSRRYTIRAIESTTQSISIFGMSDGFSTRRSALRWLIGNKQK